MKSFKQFFTERQSGHSDFFLVLAGDIKLDRVSACKIWEECGKRSTFRHITDYVGTSFLINNKDKNVTISALKFSKEVRGIETTGDITLIVEADYEIWWPEDAFTYMGFDGKRWMSIDIGKRINKILGIDFKEEYIKALVKLIKKYSNVNEFIERMKIKTKSRRSNSQLYSLEGLVMNIPSDFEDETYKIVEVYKGETAKFTKAALALQAKILDKYSDVIKKNLVYEFQQSKTNLMRRQQYSHRNLDEAVVSNVVVKQVIFTQVQELTNILNELTGGLKNIDRMKKEAADPISFKKKYGSKLDVDGMFDDLKRNMDDNMDDLYSVKMLRDANYKGLFTYRTFSKPQFGKMKEAIKDKSLENAWDYLQKHYGIKRDKDVFLRLV